MSLSFHFIVAHHTLCMDQEEISRGELTLHLEKLSFYFDFELSPHRSLILSDPSFLIRSLDAWMLKFECEQIHQL